MRLLALLLLASAKSPHAPSLEWRDVEPAANACVSIVETGEGFDLTSEGPGFAAAARALPRKARAAVRVGCAEAMPRLAFTLSDAQVAGVDAAQSGGAEAGSATLREALFGRPEAARVFRMTIAESLRQARIDCADGAPPEVPARRIAFADVRPYLVRLCFVSVDDLPGPEAPHGGFHVCTGVNDLRGLPSVDPVLAQTAYAALLNAFADDHIVARMKTCVEAACMTETRPADRTTIERINARLQASVAGDSVLMTCFAREIAAETPFYDLECTDCTSR